MYKLLLQPKENIVSMHRVPLPHAESTDAQRGKMTPENRKQ